MQPFRPKIVDIRWPSAFGIFGLGVMVGAIAFAFHAGAIYISSGSLPEINVEYADMIVVLLTAVTVIVTALGVIVAMSAFFGYNGIKKAALDAAIEEVKRQLSDNGNIRHDHDGALRDYIKTVAQKGAVDEVKKQFSVDGETQRVAGGELREYIESTIERVSTEIMLRKQGRGQFFGDEDTDYGVPE